MISQLKYKIGWEAVFVSLHLFVESPSDHTVKLVPIWHLKFITA